jgi:hypothetical protein
MIKVFLDLPLQIADGGQSIDVNLSGHKRMNKGVF